MTAARKSVPARFDASAQRRRSLIGKVHVAKAQLGLDEDTYRGVLLRVTGQTSAASCTEAQLIAAIEDFKRRGFTDQAKAGPRSVKRADHPAARKARSLWISLHQLGAVRNPSEHALEAFATRQLGTEKLQWANQAQCFKLIEALKTMAERAGWSQDLKDVRPGNHATVLKRRLVECLFDKLVAAEFAPKTWGVVRAAKEFAGIDMPGIVLASSNELELAAQAFARVLRQAEQAGEA